MHGVTSPSKCDPVDSIREAAVSAGSVQKLNAKAFLTACKAISESAAAPRCPYRNAAVATPLAIPRLLAVASMPVAAPYSCGEASLRSALLIGRRKQARSRAEQDQCSRYPRAGQIDTEATRGEIRTSGPEASAQAQELIPKTTMRAM
jgi:hypothetical protein